MCEVARHYHLHDSGESYQALIRRKHLNTPPASCCSHRVRDNGVDWEEGPPYSSLANIHQSLRSRLCVHFGSSVPSSTSRRLRG